MKENKYNRILVKLSGEALLGTRAYGVDPETIARYARELHDVRRAGVEVAVVIGGGNIYRGAEGAQWGIERAQSDQMGMLATVMNALALQSSLEGVGGESRVMSAVEIKSVCESYILRRAIRHLEKGRIVIMAGGTGNPYFTTDTAAALRALEINADVVLKATRVDGVYTADPEKDETAEKYHDLTFAEALGKRLNVMDRTAFTLSEENKLPIIVFNMNAEGSLMRVVKGETVGTLVH